MNQLAQLLLSVRDGHDPIQVEHFITARGGSLHLWGMYRQALREMDGRVNALITLWRQISDGHGLSVFSVRDAGSSAIEHAQVRRRFFDTLREFGQFFHHALGLAEHFGSMTEEQRAAHQQDFWLFRLKLVGAVDLLTAGRIQGSLLELIPALPKSMRDELNALRKDESAWVNWYDDLCVNGAPQVPQPSRSFNDTELLVMLSECSSYVPGPQLVDRESRSQVHTHADGSVLAHSADAIQCSDRLPHRSSALADSL